jgi:hypothetical protein
MFLVGMNGLAQLYAPLPGGVTRLPLMHVVAAPSWRPAQVDAFTEAREGTVTSQREPPALAHDGSKLIGQQRAERTALCGGDGSGGPQQFLVERNGDSRLHGTLADGWTGRTDSTRAQTTARQPVPGRGTRWGNRATREVFPLSSTSLNTNRGRWQRGSPRAAPR